MKKETINNIPKEEYTLKDEKFIKENLEHILDDMSSSEMNKLVNENIVFTTMEFKNRIDQIFKQLKIKGFLDDTMKYRLEDSFIRIEHQVCLFYFLTQSTVCHVLNIS